jgi:hypothetical protein
MIRAGVVRAFLLGVLIWSLPALRSQVTVYENASQYSGLVAQTTNEYGDEIRLEGTARVLTQIRFEYYADFFSNADEAAQLKIYANTGPDWKGNSSYPTPAATPLWESPFFTISRGFHVKEIPIPAIRVPDRITWTVKFYGISMRNGVSTLDPAVTNDTAGLLFYGTATVGESFNDFWERLTEGWTPVRAAGVPKNNFGVSVTAAPEVVAPRLRVGRSSSYLRVSWPAALSGFKLQYKAGLSSPWRDVTAPAKIGDFYERLLPMTFSNAVFRLNKTNSISVTPALAIDLSGGNARIRWSEPGYILQGKTNVTGQWVDLPTPGVAITNGVQVLRSLSQGMEIYRLKEEAKATSLEIFQEGETVRVRWLREASGHTLQERTFGSQLWRIVEAPIVDNGTYLEAVLPVQEAGRVFRLGR